MPTFRKNNADKPRWSRLARLPGHACLLKAMERNDFGAAQYGDQNWRNGTVDAFLDALMRHALALCSGQIADADDPGAMAHGLEHTDAIVWNALVLSELIATQQTDNTNKPTTPTKRRTRSMPTTLSYRQRRGHGGARVGAGRKAALSVAEQARLGQRIYENIFSARLVDLVERHPEHKAGLLGCLNVRDLRAFCKAHNLKERKRAHTETAKALVWAEARKDERVKNMLTPNAVETWAHVYRRDHKKHYETHFRA